MITLTESEQRICHWLAKMRHARNRATGTRDARIGPQSPEQTDLEGIGAEFAAAKMLNVYPDLDIDHRPGFDVLTHHGDRVDVKATRYKNGKLVVARWKASGEVDCYLLVIGTFPTYRIAGFVSSDEALAPHRRTNLGHGPTYAVPQSDLIAANQLAYGPAFQVDESERGE